MFASLSPVRGKSGGSASRPPEGSTGVTATRKRHSPTPAVALVLILASLAGLAPLTALAASPPGVPRSITAVAGDASATVSWFAPVSDGGSPIISFTVISAPGGLTATVAGAATSAVVTGLANGTPYTFSVRASNLAGPGPASAPSNAVSPGPPRRAPYAYVPSASERNLYVIDTATNRVAATVPLPDTAIMSAVHPAGTRVYAGNFGSISVVETATNRVIASIPTGGAGLALHPDGTRLYVARPGSFGGGIGPPPPGFLDVVDTSSNQVAASIPVGVQPASVAVNPKGTAVYVANRRDQTISVIDARTNQYLATLPVFGDPRGLAVDPSGSKVYVSGFHPFDAGRVTVIDAAALTKIAEILVDFGLEQAAVNPAGTRLYLVQQQVPFIAVVDLTTNVYAAQVRLSAIATSGIALDPSGARVYVAAVSGDPRFNSQGVLSVVDTATNRETATVTFGRYAIAPGQFIQPFPPGVLGLSAAIPNRAGDQGSATVSIQGRAFQAGASARLARVGLADIPGTAIRISPFVDALTATFDLGGKAQGAWDVVVTNPDGASATLPGGFTIEPARAGAIRVDIIGRGVIRGGGAQSYAVVVSNSSNQDSGPVSVNIQLPKQVVIPSPPDFNIPFVRPPPFPGRPELDWTGVPIYLPFGDGYWIGLVTPSLPPGGSYSVPFQVSFPLDPMTYPIQAWVNPCGMPPVSGGPSPEVLRSVDPNQARDCLLNFGIWVTKQIIGQFPPLACVTSAGEAAKDFYELINKKTKNENKPVTTLGVVGSTSSAILECVGIFVPLAAITKHAIEATKALNDFNDLLLVIGQCQNAFFPVSKTTKSVTVVVARDPNDKEGPPGVGSPRYVAGDAPTNYAVFFENVSSATAPAQQVTITDQLDASRLDVSSASLGPITFANRTLAPPPGSRAFTRDVDLRPTKNLIVRLDASINSATGLATWRFISLDPATGLLVTDPLAGFLPPNRAPPEGEGSVALTARTKPTLATGTQVRNSAAVVFDNNAPIVTREWVNSLDTDPPSSKVLPLAPIQTALSFPVTWSGTDLGSGISDYAIFVSEDGGPYREWLPLTSATAATWTGVNGRTYAFYSRARDQVGNREAPKTVAEATTKVVACRIPPSTTALPSPAANAAGWNNTDVTVTLSATDACGSGIKEITFSQTGAQTGGGAVPGASVSVRIVSEGITTITYFAKDNLGNQESPKTVTVRVDKTPPAVACSVSPSTLWPPNHKLVPVTATVTVTDTLSGPDGFILQSLTTNEGSIAEESQGWVVGSPSTSGALRAERDGRGTGREYALTWLARDLAGNTATCQATVSVPHDQRQLRREGD